MTKLGFSVEETMAAAGIGRTKLYELINSGELRACKLGTRTIILRDDLDAFLKSLQSYPVDNTEA